MIIAASLILAGIATAANVWNVVNMIRLDRIREVSHQSRLRAYEAETQMLLATSTACRPDKTPFG